MAYKVMVVDDEYPIRQGLASGVDWDSLGFELCAIASNGKEVLEKISASIPDVIITDIRMPVMDGIELIENLSLMYPRVKIVILSGYGDFEYAQKAIEYSVSAYLLKPINNEDLYKVLSTIKSELDIKTDNEEKIGKYQSKTSDKGLREYYLRQLIRGGLSDISLLKKAYEKIDVDIYENYMTAITVTLNLDKQSSCLGKLIENLDSYSQILRYPFAYYDKHVYALICSSSRIMEKEVLEAGRKIKSCFEEGIKNEHDQACLVSVGIGSTVGGIENFPKSCQEAMIASQARFYFGLGEVINYSNISEKITDKMDRNAFKTLSDDLINSVLEGKTNEVISKVRFLFHEALQDNYWNVSRLAIRSMEVYLAVLIKLEESMLDIVVPNEDEVFADLSRSETLKEFINKFDIHLKNIADQICEIKNTQENTLTFKIKQYIEDNYEKKLTLKEMADHFSLNASYLSAYFKKNTGVNLFEYILKVRMDKAKNFLKYSDEQVTIIAENIGFQDYRYFCKTFKKETGVTPLQFRLKNYL